MRAVAQEPLVRAETALETFALIIALPIGKIRDHNKDWESLQGKFSETRQNDAQVPSTMTRHPDNMSRYPQGFLLPSENRCPRIARAGHCKAISLMY